MSTKLKIPGSHPFQDPCDSVEVAAYLQENGNHTLEIITKGIPDAVVGITIVEDLTELEKSTLESTMKTDSQSIIFVDNF